MSDSPSDASRLAGTMNAITGALFLALGAYAVGWYLDKWTGNFSLLLFILSVVGIGLMISAVSATQQQAILGVFLLAMMKRASARNRSASCP